MSTSIASVSWGKDSMAMLWMLIDSGTPVDEVLFFDTGMEFDAIYRERDRMLPVLAEHGIRYTELRPKNPMWWNMLCRPVKSRKTGEVHKTGYGWCGGACRWGTTEKTRALDRYAKERNAVVYVGIAADETERLGKGEPWKRYPLAERWGMSEADCLALCYRKGNEWVEGGVRLYDVLDRVSCWCCRNKNMRELSAMRKNLPNYFERLVALERAIGEPMKKNHVLCPGQNTTETERITK